MKKNYIKLVLVAFLSLFSLSIYSQFQPFTFDSSSIVNSVGYEFPTTKDSGGCLTSFKANFIFPTILQGQSGFNGYYYKYEVKIFGRKNDGSYQTILTKMHSPEGYSSINSNGQYVYTTEMPSNYNFNNFDGYNAKLTVIKYISNNDPGNINFFEYEGVPSKYTAQVSNCSYDPDSDNDGINDSIDNCPDEPGPASNNGCPEPEGNADLTIDKNNSTTIVNTSNNNTTTPLSTNITEYIYTDSEIQINLIVKNEGEVESGNYNVGIYLSTDNDISNSQLLLEKSFSNTLPNSSQSRNISISHWYFANKLGVLGIAYIHIKLDIDEEVDEGDDESNNSFSSRKVNIKSTTSSKPPKCLDCLVEPLLQKNSIIDETPYNLSIYSFSSVKILEKKVNNKDEENIIIKNLPKGLYIINSNNESRKVYVGN